MTRAFIQSFADAGRTVETAPRRAKRIEKKCAMCGTGIENRKTYCGPCYDERLQANIAANRHKYGRVNG